MTLTLLEVKNVAVEAISIIKSYPNVVFFVESCSRSLDCLPSDSEKRCVTHADAFSMLSTICAKSYLDYFLRVWVVSQASIGDEHSI